MIDLDAWSNYEVKGYFDRLKGEYIKKQDFIMLSVTRKQRDTNMEPEEIGKIMLFIPYTDCQVNLEITSDPNMRQIYRQMLVQPNLKLVSIIFNILDSDWAEIKTLILIG